MALSQMAGRQLTLFSLLDSGLAGGHDVGLARRAGLLAGDCRLRRQLCQPAIPAWPICTARRWSTWSAAWVAGRLDRVSAILAAGGNWRFPDEAARCRRRPATRTARAADQVVYAWMPWVLLSVMVFLWGWPDVQDGLNGGDPARPNALARLPQSDVRGAPACTIVVYRTAPVARSPAGQRPGRKAGEGDLRFQLAFGHGHEHFPGGDPDGLLAADLAGDVLARVRRTF